MIEEVLHGGLSGKPGLIQNQIQMMNDVYDPERGLVVKVERAERWQIRKDSWISGAHFASSFVGSILGGGFLYLVGRYVLK